MGKFDLKQIEKDNERTRLIPQEKAFLHYSTDDLLYGLLTYKADYDVESNTLFLKQEELPTIKKMIASWLDCTVRTVGNHLRDLMDKGYINYDQTNKKYIIKNYHEKYQQVNNRTIFKLLQNMRPNTIKIYSYLLNKYIWKKSEGKTFYFSISSLLKDLGYVNVYNRLEREAIKDILFFLNLMGFITISRVYKIVNDTYIPYYSLDFATMNADELQHKHMSEIDPNLNLEQRVRICELPEDVIVVDDDGIIE